MKKQSVSINYVLYS